MSTPLKVLVIRFSSIGDIVLTTPVVRALKLQLGAEVHFLTKKTFSPILESNPYITRVIHLQNDFSTTIRELKTERYDHVIDLHHNLRSQRIKWSLGRPSTAFYKLNFEKWLRVHLRINRLPDIHIVDRYIATALKLGVINDEAGLDFFIAEHKKLDTMVRWNLQPQSYVALVTGAAHLTKCLTPDQLASLCRELQMPVVLIGGTDEKEKGDQIKGTLPDAIIVNACGQLDILQSASVVEQAAVTITHDTGMMHITAALKKPQIVIWGNTIPEFGMYPYYGHHDVPWVSFEQKDLKCRPCSKIGYSACPKGHFKCILDHSILQITAAAHSLIPSKN